MSLRFATPVIACCILLASNVWAASNKNCRLKFDNLDTKVDWQGGAGAYAGKYNPFDPLSYVQAISFDVVNDKTTGCSYFVDAEQSEKSGTYDRELQEKDDSLHYNLYIDPALTQVWMGAETSAVSVIQGVIEAGQSKKTSHTTETYYFLIDPLQLVTDHKNYKDKVKFGLWREEFDSPDRHRDDSDKVEFKAEVPKVVDVSLVDPNSEFVIGQLNRFVNFGFLTAGDSESFDLIVRYNKKYELTFESRNEGLMVNSVSSTDTIIYEFLVGGEIYDLGSGKPEKIKDQGNQGFEGDRHQLTIRIADTLDDKAQGVYTDSITGVIKAK